MSSTDFFCEDKNELIVFLLQWVILKTYTDMQVAVVISCARLRFISLITRN